MSAYSDLIIADGATAYWRLGEASGNAIDDVGTADGTWTGTPTYSVLGALLGDGDTAMTLAGGQYASTAAATGTTGSIEFWCKRARISVTEDIFDTATNGIFVRLDGATNRVYVGKQDVGFFANSTTTIADTTTWHHVIAVWDGAGEGKVFIDGVDVSNDIGTQSPGASSAFRIGANYGGTNSYQGSFDEVAIYSSALTVTTALAHYNAGITPASSVDPFGLRGFFGL